VFPLYLAVLGWAVVLGRRQTVARQGQDALIERLSRESPGTVWLRIFVARPEAFGKGVKLQAWEARGVLGIDADVIRVVAQLSSGEKVERCYPRPSAIAWSNRSVLNGSSLWFTLGRGGDALHVCADAGMRPPMLPQASTDLYRNIAGGTAPPAPAPFALEKNPVSWVLVTAFFAAIAYALLDELFLSNAMLIGNPLVPVMAVVGVLVAVAANVLARSQGVPVLESALLAALCGGAIGAACHPLAKRIDQWTAPTGFMAHDYVLEPGGRLHPAEAGADLPRLDFSQHADYWVRFQPGSTHAFELRRGGLGLWQLNKVPFNDRLRAFYEHGATAK